MEASKVCCPHEENKKTLLTAKFFPGFREAFLVHPATYRLKVFECICSGGTGRSVRGEGATTIDLSGSSAAGAWCGCPSAGLPHVVDVPRSRGTCFFVCTQTLS